MRPLYTGAAGQCLAHQDSRCHHSLGAVPAQPADGGVRPSEYLLARGQREWQRPPGLWKVPSGQAFSWGCLRHTGPARSWLGCGKQACSCVCGQLALGPGTYLAQQVCVCVCKGRFSPQ